ncbi:aminotransferase class V-fold PLP-dependent enzyme [Epibacterium ulvae]|uniref:Cysteine desulfurase family protein, VC1184 subfamily n=1 Tax=Epibacterium ulvae TaxID=1156985 RepID=A0A1G5Q9K2_9RHOB|nr:aminotransferase class V-fold PLP-dependent enzyme [Epibacterium ulvae]SCZ58535.1 cysteine desulfurase family protein, VC1184 subfamily [Epibacterium ulvae]
MSDLDVEFVRSCFPAFTEEPLADQSFFENAGGSYMCRPVLDRLNRFYTQRKVQPYGVYGASQDAGAEMDEARARLAAQMGVQTDELSFGPSTTQNVYVLVQAVRQLLKPGEAIVVTNQDHEANTGPWRRLAEDGIEVREWKVDPETGCLNPDDLQNILDENVRLVCFPHCSNIVGEINPVLELTAIAHAAGAFVCVDGVSYAPHGLPNVEELGADIYLFSAYKVYGPHQGVMVVRKGIGNLLPNQGHYFNGDVLYKRFTPAGPDHAQVAAMSGLVDYFEAFATHHGCVANNPVETGSFVHDLMRAHEVKLLQPLLDMLASDDRVRLLGPDDASRRAPTVALETHKDPVEIAKALAKEGLMVGAGNFYAVRLLQALGVDPDRGVLRISFTHYTTEAEVTKLMKALDRHL